MSIWDFFTAEAGQDRRKWLDAQGQGLLEYVPPELRPWLGVANELNPITSIERAGQGAARVADPRVQGWDKVQAIGDTASNMAGFVAPMVAASKGAVPAANAVEDALLGWSQTAGVPQFVGDESGALRSFPNLWHGSIQDFDAFSLPLAASRRQFSNAASDAGHWFSTNKQDAEFFGPNLYETSVEGNFKELPSMEEIAGAVRRRLENTYERLSRDENANYQTEQRVAQYLDYLDATHDPKFYTKTVASELAKARREGFGGAVLKGGETVQDRSAAGDHVVVFADELIKLLKKHPGQ